MSFNISNYIQSPFDAITSDINFLLFSSIGAQITQLVGVIDAIPEEDHEITVQSTKYPVETGATNTDNAFVEPTQLTITGYVSDLLVNRITTLVTPFRDREAWERIEFQLRQLNFVSVVTLLKTYNNMLIRSVKAKKDNSTGRALIFTMLLEETIIADTQLISLPKSSVTGAAENKTGVVNLGSQQSSTATNQERDGWLSQIVSYF